MPATLGGRLRTARERAGLRQAQVAAAAAIDGAYLSLIENGKRSPSPAVLARLADALDVEPGWLHAGQASTASRLITELIQFARFANDHGDFDHAEQLLDQLQEQDLGRPLTSAERDQVRWLRCGVLRGRGRHEEVLALAAPLLRRCLSGGGSLPPTMLALALLESSTALPTRPGHELADARLLGEQALCAATERGNDWWLLAATVLDERARTDHPRVAAAQGRAWLREATEPERHEGAAGMVALLRVLARIEADLGHVDDAFARISEARELRRGAATPAGDPAPSGTGSTRPTDEFIHPPDTSFALEYVHLLLLARPERAAEAVALLDRCREAATCHGRRLAGHWRRERALAEIVTGRPTSALALLRPLLDGEGTDPADVIAAWLLAGAAHETAGDLPAVRATCTHTLQLLAQAGTGQLTAYQRRQVGDRLWRAGGTFREVLGAYRDALDAVDHRSRPPLVPAQPVRAADEPPGPS